MGMVSGGHDMYLAQMWVKGAPKAPENFSWPAEGGQHFFFPMCLFSKCSDFCGEFENG